MSCQSKLDLRINGCPDKRDMVDINKLTVHQQKIALTVGYSTETEPEAAPYRVFGYCRCSTRKQELSGLGLKEQEDAIRAYAACPGNPRSNPPPIPLTITKIYVDKGVSGKSMDREEFKKLDKTIDKSDTLIVKDLSRLSRNTEEFLTFYGNMRKRGIKLIILDLPMDLNTPMGQLNMQMVAAFREFELKSSNAKTSATLQSMIASGKHIGKAAFGFKNVKGVIEEDPEEMKVVHRIGAILKENNGQISYGRIAAILNAENVHIRKASKVWPSAVDVIIRRHGLDMFKKGITGVLVNPPVITPAPDNSAAAASTPASG